MNTRALGIAVILAALGAGSIVFYVKRFERRTSGGDPVPVLFAVQEIPLGSILKEEMLGVRSLPESYVEERHIRASESSRIIGVRVQSTLKPNESVLWSDLAANHKNRDLSSLVQSGMRAVTIATNQTSTFGGLLRPGDRVDILFTSSEESMHATRPLLQNILVLAAGSDTGSASPSKARPFNQITVSVTVEQSQLLAHARQKGTLTLVLRNPNDIKILDELPETSSADLVAKQPITDNVVAKQSNKETEHVE